MDFVIASVIVANVFAIVLESVPEVGRAWAAGFWWFEVFSVAVFLIEYVVRLWACVEDPRYRGAVRGRLRYSVTPLALVDLLAIAPFFLPFLGFDLRFARMLRLLRLARVAKLGRYSSAVDSIARVIHDRKHELVASLTFMFMLILVAASLLYFAESEAQPDHFGSIPASMWWAVVTLTTVGYGDIYPITSIGRVLAGTIAILGIGMVALPTSILGSGFVEQMTKRSSPPPVCPHCGKPADLAAPDSPAEFNPSVESRRTPDPSTTHGPFPTKPPQG